MRVSAQALCCLQEIFTYRQYKRCVRERQLESVEAFSLCCYMQTCFNTSVLSPVVGSAVARSVWLVFRSWVRIPFFLSPKLASIFRIYCHAADELCGSDPQALNWFWESTGTVLSYCFNENGCLFYNSAAYWVLKAYSTKTIITLPLSNFWPLTIKNFKNLVQVSSPLLSPESSPWSSPESRVQVL